MSPKYDKRRHITKHPRGAVINAIPVPANNAFIKNLELRDRPWYFFDSETVNHLGGNGGKHKSFPSNHAANLCALATVLTYIYYKLRYIFWFFAVIIMFSRIYIGVHFPLDVFVGMLIGLSFGLLLINISINWARYHQEL